MRLWNNAFQLVLALLIGVFFISTSFGQTNPNRTYFNKSNEDCDSSNAIGYRVIQYSLVDNKSLEIIQSFRMNGTLQSEKVKTIKEYPKNSSTQLESIQQAYNFDNKYATRKNYDSLERIIEIQTLYLGHLEGAFEKFYTNGKLKAEGNYHLNKYDDTLLGYYPNGSLKRVDIFCDGKLIEGKCFGTDGKDTTHVPFYQEARFPGGDNAFNHYLILNMKYPEVALENAIQGKCYTRFNVNQDGSIDNVHIALGVAGCPECDKEALRMIKEMPNWEPSIDNEVRTISNYQLPIIFRLE